MFKQAILYRFTSEAPPLLAELEERLAARRFTECGPTQPMSTGWVPPRGNDSDVLVESIGGQWILTLKSERKSVPAATVKEALSARLDKIEADTGRRPRGKHAKELKEEVTHDLLPRAFPKKSTTRVWLDPRTGIAVIGAGSIAAADGIVSLLVETFGPGTVFRLINTTHAPAGAMASWLATQEPPADFTVDRECELKQPDSEKACVRYARHTLDIGEVAEHVRQGKLPTQLAMTWNSRVSFVLTEGTALKRITFLDVVIDGKADDGDAFDADTAIATGELTQLIPALLDALGGEVAHQAEPAAPVPRPAAPAPSRSDSDLLAQARSVVLQHRRASISLVQRHLRVGYNQAARLLEALEQEGSVTAMQADGSRQIVAIPA